METALPATPPAEVGALFGRFGLALLIPVWALVATVLALLTRFACDTGWSNGALFAMPPMLLYAFACSFSTYYMCRAWPLTQRRGIVTAAVLLSAAVLAGAGWTALAALWNMLLITFELPWAGLAAARPALALMFVSDVILFALAALGHYLAIELARVRASEQRAMAARLMAQDAQLRMLRAQIDPHFLFNSLNSISALTSLDPAAARAMTIKLADFFRHTLCTEAGRKTTLAAELALTLDFLAIEQVRFGARLRIEQAVSPAASACLLLPMILQPLVENAVKHGIGKRIEGGVVRIEAQKIGSCLRLSVENPVDTEAAHDRAGSRPAGRGMGLANVRERLVTAYGEQAALHWGMRAQGFRVELSMPAETGDGASSVDIDSGLPACA
ncbi:sensor histidine kinase [Massilia sp. PWRC2]|uniref:sensor histidine kinase n=1 Tax=Massilia sp. PWRC2 TaxID=2804626 RepID=UPI003CF43B33